MGRLTIQKLRKLKGERKILMLTAYDAPSARLVDDVADIALVGDSVATTIEGKPDTLGATMPQMLYHTRIVANNTQKSLVVGDMPFLSYQASDADALRNAGLFLKEGGAQAVKLEGGRAAAPRIKAITSAGIPVMGHLGFTPQSVNTSGVTVYRDKDTLIEDAKALVEAGVFSIVLELVPTAIAKAVTEAVNVPTIGIGAGPDTDGQVLVFHDLLGFDPGFHARFVKRYFDFHSGAASALKQFREDVMNGKYPGTEHSYE